MYSLIEKIVKNAVYEALLEGRYTSTATPYNSHGDRYRTMGTNPLTVDVGGHSTNDVVGQPSTFDNNGANFRTSNNIILSPNRFTFYKVKNFGNDKIKGTLDIFGSEKELRRAIDVLNGGATRNHKSVSYRTICDDETKAKQVGRAFWEFSLDGGSSWFILKPDPLQSMKASSLK